MWSYSPMRVEVKLICHCSLAHSPGGPCVLTMVAMGLKTPLYCPLPVSFASP